ncbi:MAG TPA: CoA-binding protein [Gemmataceae bacterium]|nr:CoA-binding protein [Gemmataceae bacterium]
MSQPTIAVMGASSNRRKFGNKCVRAYIRQGYQVFPVNPREKTIEGLKAYPSLAEIPVAALDRVSLYLPPRVGLGVLDQIAAKSVGQVWLNPGTESPELLARARELKLPVVRGCSIVDIGISPSELDE